MSRFYIVAIHTKTSLSFFHCPTFGSLAVADLLCCPRGNGGSFTCDVARFNLVVFSCESLD